MPAREHKARTFNVTRSKLLHLRKSLKAEEIGLLPVPIAAC